MFELYYWPTPNGKKVAIPLEEAALPYRVVPVDIRNGDQFAESNNEYTIADIVSYPWSLNRQTLGQNIDEFEHLKRRLADVWSRPAVQRGMDVGKELAVDVWKVPKGRASAA